MIYLRFVAILKNAQVLRFAQDDSDGMATDAFATRKLIANG
jgi:hypothetical protein